MKKIIVFVLLLLGFLLFFQTFSQESLNFKLTEHVFNQGGHPFGGVVLSTANFTLTIGSVGEITDNSPLNSDSFSLTSNFLSAYPPPGEVMGLHFLSDHETLIWNLERSKGSYNLYRDELHRLISDEYGHCLDYGMTDETYIDSQEPQAGRGYFYLVTVKNRLGEEGTKGYSSDEERLNPDPCP